VPFVRAIGRWTMTALVVNTIIGSGIFGVPSELTRLLGRASPLAFLFAALAMAVIMLCMAEVASQFSEPGGPYLYVRTAFGRFLGTQVAWFHLLTMIGSGAAGAALFMAYCSGFLPVAVHGDLRIALLAIVIIIPVMANYLGVRAGASFASLLTIAKLLPLVLLIGFGIIRFSRHFEFLSLSDLASPTRTSWLTALLLLVFTYGGFEDALVPTGEVERPRYTVPFALIFGVLGCAIVYVLVQFVTVATIGTTPTDRPLAEAASALMKGGGAIITIAVLISTYGTLSGCVLNCPRLVCSLSSQGDFPRFFGSLHPRFNTPTRAIVVYALLVWVLASSGTFVWAVMLSGGSAVLIYAGTSAALIRLRRQNPNADALRMPFEMTLAVLGIVVSLSFLTQLESRQALLMSMTALTAGANWWWANRRELQKPSPAGATSASH